MPIITHFNNYFTFTYIPPIQALTRLDPAYLPGSDKIGCVQGCLDVDIYCHNFRNFLYTANCSKTPSIYIRFLTSFLVCQKTNVSKMTHFWWWVFGFPTKDFTSVSHPVTLYSPPSSDICLTSREALDYVIHSREGSRGVLNDDISHASHCRGTLSSVCICWIEATVGWAQLSAYWWWARVVSLAHSLWSFVPGVRGKACTVAGSFS